MSSQIYTIGNRWIKWGIVVKSIRVESFDGSDLTITLVNGSQRIIQSGVSTLIADFPGGFEVVEALNVKTIVMSTNVTFDTSELSQYVNMTGLSAFSTAVLSGDIANLPDTITIIDIRPTCYLYGDIANLPSSLIDIRLDSLGLLNGGIYGDVANLTCPLKELQIVGTACSITGDIANLTSLTYLWLQDSNTLYGNISSLPTNVTTFFIYGQCNITPDFENWNNTVLGILRIYGVSTGTINVADLPQTLVSIFLGGIPLIGLASDLPANLLEVVSTINVTGTFNQLPSAVLTFRTTYNVTGDLALWIGNWRDVRIEPTSAISYSTHDFSVHPLMIRIEIYGSNGLTSAEVDQMLIDMVSGNWFSRKVIVIGGNSQPRTSASDAAVASLVAQGVSVTTN